MVAHKARKIYNIDILEPLCRLDMLDETEKILSTLWVELVVDLQVCFCITFISNAIFRSMCWG